MSAQRLPKEDISAFGPQDIKDNDGLPTQTQDFEVLGYQTNTALNVHNLLQGEKDDPLQTMENSGNRLSAVTVLHYLQDAISRYTTFLETLPSEENIISNSLIASNLIEIEEERETLKMHDPRQIAEAKAKRAKAIEFYNEIEKVIVFLDQYMLSYRGEIIATTPEMETLLSILDIYTTKLEFHTEQYRKNQVSHKTSQLEQEAKSSNNTQKVWFRPGIRDRMKYFVETIGALSNEQKKHITDLGPQISNMIQVRKQEYRNASIAFYEACNAKVSTMIDTAEKLLTGANNPDNTAAITEVIRTALAFWNLASEGKSDISAITAKSHLLGEALNHKISMDVRIKDAMALKYPLVIFAFYLDQSSKKSSIMTEDFLAETVFDAGFHGRREFTNWIKTISPETHNKIRHLMRSLLSLANALATNIVRKNRMEIQRIEPEQPRDMTRQHKSAQEYFKDRITDEIQSLIDQFSGPKQELVAANITGSLLKDIPQKISDLIHFLQFIFEDNDFLAKNSEIITNIWNEVGNLQGAGIIV